MNVDKNLRTIFLRIQKVLRRNMARKNMKLRKDKENEKNKTHNKDK